MKNFFPERTGYEYFKEQNDWCYDWDLITL